MQLYERVHIQHVTALSFSVTATRAHQTVRYRISSLLEKEIHPTLPEQPVFTKLPKERTSSADDPVGTTGGSGQFLPATQMVFTTEYHENLTTVLLIYIYA
jgi:hypothetical protein